MALNILIGCVAGCVSAVLFASLLSGSLLALVLCLLSPLPIMIVAMGWSNRAGLAAAIVSAGLLAAAFGPALGLTFACATAAPAWALSYLVMLGRREGNAVVEWFPVGNVVAIAAVMGVLVGLLTTFSIGTSYESYTAAVRKIVEAMLRSVAGTPEGSPLAIPDVEDPAALVEFVADIIPLLSSATWVFPTLFNLWLAGRVVRTSGRLSRPWPDLPAMRLPRWIIPALAASLVACFAPGMLGLCGRIAAAALVTPFTIVGFAALHDMTRGMSARPALLGALYVLTFLLNWIALLVVTLFGLVDHFFELRRSTGSRGRHANDNS